MMMARITKFKEDKDINLLNIIKYDIENDRWYIINPDEVLTVWTVLTLIQFGFKVSKNWIDNQEIMEIS